MSLPVVLIATVQTNPHCGPFLNMWKRIHEQLQARSPGQFRFFHLQKTYLNDPLPPEYPNKLYEWIKWYPSLMIFDGVSWDHGLDPDRNSHLKGTIFNGEYVDISTRYVHRDDPSEESIMDWFQSNVPIFLHYQKLHRRAESIYEEVSLVYHQFTMSPTWMRSESGLFTPVPAKSLRGPSALRLESQMESYLTTDIHERDLFNHYRNLGLAQEWSFSRSTREHGNFLGKHLQLMLDRYDI